MAELPAGLLADALTAAGDPPPAPAPSPPERLGAHAVLRYAIDDELDVYRRVMRVMWLEHQAFGLRLRPEQVSDRLRERFGREVDRDWLEQRLSALVGWGALERDHDAGLASSAADWRRNRYVYDITAAGQLTEELLARLDALGEEHGRLEGDRLPAILDALRRLVAALDAEGSPDGTALRTLLEQVFGQVEQLHEAALSFMRSLGALIRRAEQVDEGEFEATKGALLEHLQGFRQDRRRWSADVLDGIDAVERAGAARLVEAIVDAEEFVAMPGGATVEAQHARRTAELTERWRGVRAWFVGDGAGGSAWKVLDDHVLDAIRAVLGIAERLIERRSQRVDRVHVLLALAGRAAAAPPGEAVAWVRAALAIRSPRHVAVPERDPDQVVDRGRTPWRDAPPAPVVAYLRRPGATAPGRGRGARLLDLEAGRRRVLESRARERVELEDLLRRFAGRGTVRLSALAEVDEREFAHLLRWIGRAYESSAAADGTRNALSIDGRAAIVLRAPPDPAAHRATLRAPHGRLDLPDYALEVRTR